MFFYIEMTAAVVFFLAMLTRTCFLKSTWQQLMTVALQVISVWCLIHLFLSHVYPEFLFAKNVEVISSNPLGDKWISILVHRKEIDIHSNIMLKSKEDEILIKSV